MAARAEPTGARPLIGRAPLAAWSALLLAGCIPQADPPPRRAYAPPPAREYSPARDDAPPEDGAADADAVRAANRRSLDETPPSPRDYRRVTPARPTWEARPATPDAATIADGLVTVRPGESLRAIATRSGSSPGAIARANGLSLQNEIRPGQRLRVPGGRYHLVRPGQSGIAIARAYGVPWARIVDANGLEEPYILHAGDRVLIPGDAGRPVSAAERSAAFKLDIDDILTGGEPALAVGQAPLSPTANSSRPLPPEIAIAPPPRLGSGGFAWPVDGRLIRRFGAGESGERNDGIDIAVPARTPVLAAADGVVSYVGNNISALGGVVLVKHGGGWTSVYAHADRLLVHRGQRVTRGQTIALSGRSGNVDRPELHFELRHGRLPVDPATQLPER